jgi:hypothetical protein
VHDRARIWAVTQEAVVPSLPLLVNHNSSVVNHLGALFRQKPFAAGAFLQDLFRTLGRLTWRNARIMRALGGSVRVSYEALAPQRKWLFELRNSAVYYA